MFNATISTTDAKGHFGFVSDARSIVHHMFVAVLEHVCTSFSWPHHASANALKAERCRWTLTPFCSSEV